MSSGDMNVISCSPEAQVYQALRGATDANLEVVKKSELLLREWEQQAGFFPMLAKCCVNQQLEVNIRWMSVVFLKNAITKYWHRNTKYELPAAEKQEIRQILQSNCVSEPVKQVALQLAVLVAQIGRIDCPREWPQLLPFLLERLELTIKSKNSTEQHRVLLVVHHVIKALASRRLMAEKRIFEQLSQNIFVFIQKLWNDLTEQFFQELDQLSSHTSETLERALLTLRILRKLSNFGFSKPDKFEPCMMFIEQLFHNLDNCVKCRYELKHKYATAEDLISLLEKFILKQIKTLFDFQDVHAVPFARFVPKALEFTFNYVFHDGARYIFTNNIINFRNFVIHCMNLMKGIMLCHAYSITSKERKMTQKLIQRDDLDIDIQSTLSSFFSAERLSYICEKIISHYFLLTQVELDNWFEDPEGFAQDDAGECWKYALTPSVENLYTACVVQYQTQMYDEVLKFFNKAQATHLSENCSLKDILLKDAIYKALGLAAYFSVDIDFDNWFSGQLLTELRMKSENFRILRRRIIWLVGQFAEVKFARNLRPMAYEACLHLLGPQEDMAVRLAASVTLSKLLMDYEFLPLDFVPYLEAEFNALFLLLHDAKECETKMYVLTVMTTLVETMSDYMKNLADKLIGYLPLLWKESEDYNMLRCSIICTLQQLVKAFCDIPETMKSFLYCVIEISTNLQEPCHVYLMEDGLILWLSVVENSDICNPDLLQLCKNLLPIIEQSTENLRCILLLIQAYVLLDARVYLQLYGKLFVDYCTRMFDDIRPEGAVLILKVFETCLKTEPNISLQILRPSLPYIFKQVYLNNELPMVMIMYLTIVARVLLTDQNMFNAVLEELQISNAFEKILEVWISKMPLVTEADKRKLFGLAFSSMFVFNNPAFCERFAAVLLHIAQTLREVMRKEDDVNNGPCIEPASDGNAECATNSEKKIAKLVDSLVFEDENDLNTSNFCMDDFDYKTYHYDRLRQLSLKDPVHKIQLDQCVKWHLNAMRSQIGEEHFQNLMRSVPGTTLELLHDYIPFD